MNTQRPAVRAAAVALQVLISLVNIGFSIPDLINGPAPDGPPMFIVVLSIVIGVLGLVTAWGLWQGKRWGMISTVVIRVMDVLGTVPGIFFAPTLFLQIACVVGVILSVTVIVLLFLPASRRAYA